MLLTPSDYIQEIIENYSLYLHRLLNLIDLNLLQDIDHYITLKPLATAKGSFTSPKRDWTAHDEIVEVNAPYLRAQGIVCPPLRESNLGP